MTEALNFNLSDFIDVAGSAAPPITSLAGSVSITFDPTLSYTDTTTGLVIHSLTNAPIGSTVGFSYDPTSKNLSIGGTNAGTGRIALGTDDFVIQYDLTNLASPRFDLCSDPGFNCATATGSQVFYASGYTLAADPSDAFLAKVASGVSVPEPTSLTLLIGGLVSLAGFVRRGGSAARRARRDGGAALAA